MFPSASCQMTSKIASAGASAKAILTSPWGSPSRSRSSRSARWDGWWTVGSARGRGSRWWALRSAGSAGSWPSTIACSATRSGEALPCAAAPWAGAGGGGGAVAWPGWGDRRGGGGGGTVRGGGAAATRDARPPAGFHGPLARRDGCSGAGARGAAGVCGDRARRPCPAARVARLPRSAFAAALCGDGIPEMIQGPDIGKAIFEHTSDSYVIEWPFGLATHLTTDWVIFSVNVSPTKHVFFLGIAAARVVLTD